jgi:four helix bundle protein
MENRDHSKIKTFRDLLIWQKAMIFVTKVYKATMKYPRSETMGLISQLRRASVSVPSNIAEGFGRHAQRDFARFMHFAMGSLFEVQTQLEISHNLTMLPDAEYNELIEDSKEMERMMSSFIRSLK